MEREDQTIAEFGEQWQTFRDTGGWFGSRELLADFIFPFDPAAFVGGYGLDLGAGTGRFTRALLEFGAARVVALEPSEARHVIPETLPGALKDQVTILDCRGDQLAQENAFDFIISIGVIHHIPEPLPVIAAAHRALKPGGVFIVWLYGREGNRLYLAFLHLLRALTGWMPPSGKRLIATLLTPPLGLYIRLCSLWPRLPLGDYMNNIMAKLSRDKRLLVIYDQLNPTHAHYYTREEAWRLLTSQPFDVALHHRRGYSWLGICRKKLPDAA